jgi:hypothetical protein
MASKFQDSIRSGQSILQCCHLDYALKSQGLHISEVKDQAHVFVDHSKTQFYSVLSKKLAKI